MNGLFLFCNKKKDAGKQGDKNRDYETIWDRIQMKIEKSQPYIYITKPVKIMTSGKINFYV